MSRKEKDKEFDINAVKIPNHVGLLPMMSNILPRVLRTLHDLIFKVYPLLLNVIHLLIVPALKLMT